MVGAEQRADLRVHAGEAPADRLHLWLRAAHLVHVGGGPADVAHHSLERWIRRHAPAPAAPKPGSGLDGAPLVRGDGAEGAPAEAAAHDGDGVLHHLVGRDLLLVARVRSACIGEIGRVLYHRPVAMPLQNAAGVEGIRFVMDLTGCFAEGALVCAHLCQAGDGHHVESSRKGPRWRRGHT